MDKTFKQRLEILPIKNIEHPVGNTKYYAAVHVKSLIAQADEEFQELKEQHGNQAESILLMLDEIKSLKSQLQQQALPVVPEFVDTTIKQSNSNNLSLYGTLVMILSDTTTEIYDWISKGNQNIFALAFITRKYTIEKPQLFYLKNKLTRKYLRKSKHTKDDWNEDFDRVETVNNKTKFTQSEIDSMNIGSYEQIEVAE
ncbi:DUF1642 domain-containing protein [Lactococcus lactis subsp. lactis]|uniref:DUF1642 domain-containing protein n=1 Tax=Lactococcus lactis TaxID=1358 RepID=UPI003D1B52DD